MFNLVKYHPERPRFWDNEDWEGPGTAQVVLTSHWILRVHTLIIDRRDEKVKEKMDYFTAPHQAAMIMNHNVSATSDHQIGDNFGVQGSTSSGR